MKIYTKTGDKGQTGLFGGSRVSKDDARIDAYGTTDELNAFVGLLRDSISNASVRKTLLAVQHHLFSIGAYLATPPEKQQANPGVEMADIEMLETAMDSMDAELEPLRNFILPGGHTTVSYAHIARTVCRRAERATVALLSVQEIDALLLQYLNRLSDYFFILARYLAKELGVEEIKWTSAK